MNELKEHMDEAWLPTPEQIRAAVPRVAPHLHRTPLWSSRTLSERTGFEVLLKCENLQRTGCFKPRGALNRIATLSPEARRRGVITISAGNNAQGVAFAAREEGVPAVIVMPEHAAASKVEATRGYGAEVVLHGDVHAAFEKLEEIRRERDLHLIHPFDDPMLIAGHGTLGLEIAEQAGGADAVVCGVGGGGMLAGLGLALAEALPEARLVGVEPEGAATMSAALEADEPVRLERLETIADGLAPPFVGERNLAVARERLSELVLVRDDEIVAAMRLLLERTKLLVEPSGSAGLAALLIGRVDLTPGSRVVVVLSGGNVDLPVLGRLVAGEGP